jgi:hypothetical protein
MYIMVKMTNILANIYVSHGMSILINMTKIIANS